MKPPGPFEVWLTTVQSGSCVPGFIATVCVMQGGCSCALISIAMRSSDGPKLSAQIGNTRPLAPNWFTNSTMRTDGSAKLPSLAVHECAICGQGQDGRAARRVGRAGRLPVDGVRRRRDR